MLKHVLDSVEGLSEELTSNYTKGDDGKFYIQVEGMVPRARLDEFRESNLSLKAKLDSYNGVDVDEYHRLKELETNLKGKKQLSDQQIEAIVSERVKALKQSHEEEVAGYKERETKSSTMLHELLISNEVKSAASRHGALPEASEDLLLRAKALFTVDNGKAVAKDANGMIKYDVDGTTPLSVDKWVKSMKKDAPHLFADFQGTGAKGNRGGAGDRSKLNPIQKIAAGLDAR